METSFGQKITKLVNVKFHSVEEKKLENKRIRKEIKELEELLKHYNLYLDGKKSYVLTMEQVKEDIKKAKEKIEVLKKI